MKTMALTGIRSMKMMDVPAPLIKNDNDVLICMKAVGVCGSDVHYYSTGKIGSQVVEYPFTVGHEGAGVVEAVGAGVKGLSPGTRVAFDPAVYCGKCDQCLAGRPHTCRQLVFLGCPGQAEGCLSEFIVLPDFCCFPISGNLSFDYAVLSEPLAISIYAARQSIKLKGASVAVLGAGPIGLGVQLACIDEGARRVYVTDKIDERLEASSGAGAFWAGNPDKADIVSEITLREPLLMDAVFECCGQQEALDQAVQMLKPGGKLMLIGIPEVDRVAFNIDALRRKEICIQNVRRQNGCTEVALQKMSDKKIVPDFIVTHHFKFEKTPAAFDCVDKYRDGVIKAIIEF